MVTLALKDAGIDVVAVANGQAAVRQIPELMPDLVLADIFMPARTGYEVCEFVKRDSRYSHIPVVLLVGAFDPFDETEAKRVRADGVLKKPFVPPDPLIKMVKSLLGNLANDANGHGSHRAHDGKDATPVFVSTAASNQAPAKFPARPSGTSTIEALRPGPAAVDAASREVLRGKVLITPPPLEPLTVEAEELPVIEFGTDFSAARSVRETTFAGPPTLLELPEIMLTPVEATRQAQPDTEPGAQLHAQLNAQRDAQPGTESDTQHDAVITSSRDPILGEPAFWRQAEAPVAAGEMTQDHGWGLEPLEVEDETKEDTELPHVERYDPEGAISLDAPDRLPEAVADAVNELTAEPAPAAEPERATEPAPLATGAGSDFSADFSSSETLETVEPLETIAAPEPERIEPAAPQTAEPELRNADESVYPLLASEEPPTAAEPAPLANNELDSDFRWAAEEQPVSEEALAKILLSTAAEHAAGPPTEPAKNVPAPRQKRGPDTLLDMSPVVPFPAAETGNPAGSASLHAVVESSEELPPASLLQSPDAAPTDAPIEAAAPEIAHASEPASVLTVRDSDSLPAPEPPHAHPNLWPELASEPVVDLLSPPATEQAPAEPVPAATAKELSQAPVQPQQLQRHERGAVPDIDAPLEAVSADSAEAAVHTEPGAAHEPAEAAMPPALDRWADLLAAPNMAERGRVHEPESHPAGEIGFHSVVPSSPTVLHDLVHEAVTAAVRDVFPRPAPVSEPDAASSVETSPATYDPAPAPLSAGIPEEAETREAPESLAMSEVAESHQQVAGIQANQTPEPSNRPSSAVAVATQQLHQAEELHQAAEPHESGEAHSDAFISPLLSARMNDFVRDWPSALRPSALSVNPAAEITETPPTAAPQPDADLHVGSSSTTSAPPMQFAPVIDTEGPPVVHADATSAIAAVPTPAFTSAEGAPVAEPVRAALVSCIEPPVTVPSAEIAPFAANFTSAPVANSADAASPLTSEALDSIVNRIVERVQPKFMELFTREVLRPVVEAVVRGELVKH